MKETTSMAGPRRGVGAAPSRRQVLGAASAVALGGWWPAARAQNDFPDKPVRIVVPYSAGTGSDVIARLVAQGLSEKTGQSFFVENREGGGSLIGTLAVVKAPPDGHTLLMAANPTVIVPSQSPNPAYRPLDDLLPVAKVAVIPLILVASPALKVGSVRELVAYAKANPGKLSYGSSGPGTISQQEMELFKQAMGLDIPEIPYKSTAQAMTDVIGGTLSLLPAVVPLVAPHVQSGRARALTVLDDQRSTLLPDVPAIGEDPATRGYQPTPVWYGFVAPARTPVAIAQTLAGMIDEAMKSPDMPGKLQVQGARAVSVGMARFATDMKVEYEKAVVLARKAGEHK